MTVKKKKVTTSRVVLIDMRDVSRCRSCRAEIVNISGEPKETLCSECEDILEYRKRSRAVSHDG